MLLMCSYRKQLGGEKMAVKIDKELCNACGSCVDECAFDALSVEDVAICNEEECTECEACIDVCPTNAISL